MTSDSTPAGPVLVCGGAGYIGSHTVRLFAKRGVPVVVLDNLSTGHRTSVDAPFEEVDLGDREALAGVFERHAPVAVVHFAAKCYVGESVTEPSKYYRENVTYTWNLLEAMRAGGCRDIVFSSTCATYGDPVEVPMTEAHPQNPINPYGRTKLHMEHMMQDYAHAYGIRYAALRYFNAAGASPDGDLGEDHDPETHLIPLVLAGGPGHRREEISVFGDRLRHARRHVHPRLHPRRRPGGRAPAGARAACRRGRRDDRLQSRARGRATRVLRADRAARAR